MSIVMFAFAQALNVNTDTTLQHCITKCLTGIVEKYTWDKFSNAVDLSHIEFAEDEKRGIQFLVRTYLSNINFSSNIPASTPKTVAIADQDSTANEKSKSVNTSGPTDIMKRNQIFGNVCTCVNFLLSVNTPGGMLTPQSQNLATVQLFVNEDSRENYIKLLVIHATYCLSTYLLLFVYIHIMLYIDWCRVWFRIQSYRIRKELRILLWHIFTKMQHKWNPVSIQHCTSFCKFLLKLRKKQ